MNRVAVGLQGGLSAMTPITLEIENRHFHGGAGVSAGNRHLGFRSAFRDQATGRIYLSRFANGQPAPIHLLDGLPDHLVVAREHSGRVLEVRDTVEAGFEQGGRFYTREQARRIA
jgi:hypothetical protein